MSYSLWEWIGLPMPPGLQLWWWGCLAEEVGDTHKGTAGSRVEDAEVGFGRIYESRRASLVTQMVKRLPAMQETWVRFLGQKDPLEKEMAIHSSTLAWKIPWTEEPDRLQCMGSQRVGHDWATSLSLWKLWAWILPF